MTRRTQFRSTGTTTTGRRLIGLLAAASLVAAACGGDDSGSDATDAPDATEAPDVTEAPDETVADTTADTTPDTSVATGAQVGFDQVQPAVIQIIAEGTIRDPELGTASNAGSGSGFIISPDGIAVTNNHVVTGAATLEVYVGGEVDKSFNAVVLGVSECNDLAVIDITEDEPLPYLEWYDGELSAGLEVYAAGFPLGDPEFTLTRGIVAKAEASGETPWASIDSTIEHDANIQPGNSGGPLVTAEGQVAAINYATGSETNTSQFFAIRNDLARPVVDRLIDGDFETLGINGQAIVDEEAEISGIWVAGVAPGSPASDAEILPGDIVTTMNGLPIGGDGTYSDYCDVLRTSGDRPINVEVLRYDTSEVLRGELNGDKPLELAFSFATELEEQVADDPATNPEPEITGYQTLTDDTGVLTVDVPIEWSDVVTSPFTLDDGTEAPQIMASTSITDFEATFNVPGLFFTVVGPQASLDETLAGFAQSNCTDAGIQDYSDAVYTGRYQTFTDCAGTTTVYVTVAAVPADNSFTAIVVMQLVSDADLAVLDQVFATFFVTS
jgi:serine protease Do